MKLYAMNGEPFKDAELLAEHAAAREIGILKLGEKILDAYCGIGTIGLCAAANAEGI